MRLTEKAHKEIEKILHLGDRAIDATAGNGHDTEFLARQVGLDGKVFAIDRQEGSIEASKFLIKRAGLEKRVTFFHSCHSEILKLIPSELKGEIRAVTFNLGYLPGGDKELITTHKTTLPALSQAYEFISVEGIISLISYRGHSGGKEEYYNLEKLLEEKNWSVQRFHGNQSKDCPVLFLIHKT